MKPFEKRLLKIDTSRIENAKRYAFNALKAYDAVLPKIAVAIKRDITPEDMKLISKGGDSFIVEFYKPQFPFPNAPFDFNMQALGINVQPVIDLMQNLNPLHYDVDIIDNKLSVSESQQQQFVEDATTYTVNEKQNEILDLIEVVSDAFVKFGEVGFAGRFDIVNIGRACRLLDVKNDKVTFNPHYITDIKG